MPYEQRWNQNLTEDCPATEWEAQYLGPKGPLDPPTMVEVPCRSCYGRGKKRVGGYETVWVDPGPPV